MSNSPRIDNLESHNNLVINGNFDFWQRGTTFTRTALAAFAGYVGADRWFHNQGGGTTSYTISRQADVPSQAESGFQSTYSMRYLNSASTSTWLAYSYSLEGYDYSSIHSKPFRLQFWVKTSLVGNYGITFKNASETRSYSRVYNVPVANVWTKIAIDIVADTTGTWDFTNGLGLQIYFVINNGTGAGPSATSNNVWESTAARQPNGSFANFGNTVGATFSIAQVSVVARTFTQSSVVPFKRAGKTIQQELAMCQRYYEKSYNTDIAPASTSQPGPERFRAHSINHLQPVIYSVVKRATPTVVYYSNSTGASGQWSDISAGVDRATTISTNGFRANCGTVSAAVDGNGMEGHWTASAEL